MTRRERLITAIAGGTPDVVPVAPGIHWRYAEKHYGRYHWRDIIEIHRELGTCGTPRLPISIGPNSDYDSRWGMETRVLECQGIERTIERRIRTAKGELTAVHTIGFDPADPTLGFQKEYFVKEPQDWDVVEAYWQDELERGGRPEHAQIDEAVGRFGEDGGAGTINNSSFARLCLMRGMTGMLYDLVDMPDRMHRLMDLAWQYRERELQSFLESQSAMFTYDICWATGSNMSPEMFREWLFDDLCRVCAKVRSVPGKYIGFYTLGRLRRILDLLAESGPHFLASFEQNEGDMTLAEAKKRIGTKVCLVGNFDPLVLQDGTLEDARREARRCLDEGMAGGAYVMSTGDEVPPTTKPDNLKAMVEVAERYGRY
jgi:hypothetical protein